MSEAWLDELMFDADGLIPAVAQETGTGKLLTLAWMNRQSLAETVRSGRAVYWSRSRKRLWRKGEESGHVQLVKQIRLDCDADAIVVEVEQVGGTQGLAPSSAGTRRWRNNLPTSRCG